jgi:hypothetical protein
LRAAGLAAAAFFAAGFAGAAFFAVFLAAGTGLRAGFAAFCGLRALAAAAVFFAGLAFPPAVFFFAAGAVFRLEFAILFHLMSLGGRVL